MFYEQFDKLCKERKTTPTALVKRLGYSTSKITAWKNGSIPKQETLSELAESLGVKVSAFFEKEIMAEDKENDIAKTIAANIKQLSKQQKRPVSGMLTACEMNRNFIYDLEKKNAIPSIDKLIRIAHYYNVSTDRLLVEKENDTDNDTTNKKENEVMEKINNEIYKSGAEVLFDRFRIGCRAGEDTDASFADVLNYCDSLNVSEKRAGDLRRYEVYLTVDEVAYLTSIYGLEKDEKLIALSKELNRCNIRSDKSDLAGKKKSNLELITQTVTVKGNAGPEVIEVPNVVVRVGEKENEQSPNNNVNQQMSAILEAINQLKASVNESLSGFELRLKELESKIEENA